LADFLLANPLDYKNVVEDYSMMENCQFFFFVQTVNSTPNFCISRIFQIALPFHISLIDGSALARKSWRVCVTYLQTALVFETSLLNVQIFP
jgi:hypothetical protein